ncbi:MAG: hypothetical protein ABJP45_07830 [Cyclobacteriaceae bacterium]
MKTYSRFLLPVLCIGLVSLVTQCTTDDVEEEMDPTEIDLSDANALAEALSVTGATLELGDPPPPSNDPNAPQINDTRDEVAFQGGDLTFGLDVSSGDVAGVFLQIPGANSYYDIPASALMGGRIAVSDQAFSIELPENIEPGEFCVDYCVYDSNARVSNVVNVCVTVGELGGVNSEFLLGSWNITMLVHLEGEETRTEIVGEETLDIYFEEIVCSDGQTFEEVEIEESETIDFIRITFAESGALRFEEAGEEVYLDFDASTCEELEYLTETYSDDWAGAWSYDELSDRLVMIINEVEDEIEDQNVIDLTITVTDNTMVGVQMLEGETTTVTLVKQQ